MLTADFGAFFLDTLANPWVCTKAGQELNMENGSLGITSEKTQYHSW